MTTGDVPAGATVPGEIVLNVATKSISVDGKPFPFAVLPGWSAADAGAPVLHVSILARSIRVVSGDKEREASDRETAAARKRARRQEELEKSNTVSDGT